MAKKKAKATGKSQARRSDEIQGSKITKIRTLQSWFDHGKWIELEDDSGRTYRLDVKEFLKLMNELTFRKKKAIKHVHLTISKLNSVKV